jgi:aspartate aminotransferase-like enzyme
MNDKNMLSFAVGPVMMSDDTLALGEEQIPYFRTETFSQMMFENESMVLEDMQAPVGSRCLFLTASGTGAMESAVLNLLNKEKDKVLVINGGSFGARWAQLCSTHGVPFEELKVAPGSTVHPNDFLPFENKGFTALLIQGCETSTGVAYDLDLVAAFVKRNHLFFIVDAVSAFLADPIGMKGLGINAMLSGSQKALAVPPGISFVCIDEVAQKRAKENNTPVMYFNYPLYLDNMARGQTPFTPACGILSQIHQRLLSIKKAGGIDAAVNETASKADYFRKALKKAQLPFVPFAERPSNSVTALRVTGKMDAYSLFHLVFERYGIYLCPNGGDLKEKVFRVGHIGFLTAKDYDRLIQALSELKEENVL